LSYPMRRCVAALRQADLRAMRWTHLSFGMRS
jgi:hypothetical protein